MDSKELSQVMEKNAKYILELEHEIEKYKNAWKRIINEECAKDEIHCTCVPALKIRIAELEKKLKE